MDVWTSIIIKIRQVVIINPSKYTPKLYLNAFVIMFRDTFAAYPV